MWREAFIFGPIVKGAKGVDAVDTTVEVAFQGLLSTRLSRSKVCRSRWSPGVDARPSRT
jgi:hypothetical protein